MSNFISYEQILKDRENFRRSGTLQGPSFNITDTPGVKYFRIFFYFENGDVDGKLSGSSSGLLAPTWLYNVSDKDLYKHTSAWSYLKLNYEDERADLLAQFVNLLSNINSQSPWYFSEITGIDSALERKQTVDKDFMFEAERKKLTIKCLPDSFDDRIATLLDLYRSITWSWTNKREILPANLRKFDMGIMIFEGTNTPFHAVSSKKDQFDQYAIIGDSSSQYRTSYKYIEFHNCEIDYNSSKSAWSTLSNKEGVIPEYSIEIDYDDCYESRYNEFALKELGDFIEWDWDYRKEYQNSGKSFNAKMYQGLSQRMEFYGHVGDEEPSNKKITSNLARTDIVRREADTQKKLTKNIAKKDKEDWLIKPIKNALGQTIGTGLNYGLHYLKRAVLGNLFTFSLTKMADQLKGAASGNVWSTTRAILEYKQDAKHRQEGNITYITKEDSDGIKRVGQFTDDVNFGEGYEDHDNSKITYITKEDSDGIKRISKFTDDVNFGEGYEDHDNSKITYVQTADEDQIKRIGQFTDDVNFGSEKYDEPHIKYVKKVGNLFTAQTLQNNI